MTATTPPTPPDLPIWARGDAFPASPGGWGWMDPKGAFHPVEGLEQLQETIRTDRNASVVLVWTPENSHLGVPEEIPELADALRAARARWTRDDLSDARYRMRWLGTGTALFAAWALLHGFALARAISQQSPTPFSGLQKSYIAFRALLASHPVGLALLAFLIFAFIPWYQARKRLKQLGKWTASGMAAAVPALRFETWLDRQKAPVTRILLAMMLIVGLTQWFGHVSSQGWTAILGIFHNWEGISPAGLVKDAYARGEWWRLYTAPFLHGNVVHFLMNASALLYLGKRVELFARWPHLPLVFLFSMCFGGETSARLVAAPTVGASGGLMGWLGFLLVFETLHKELVPKDARRRLAAGVALTALIGLIGYRYVDNAAHAGGLLSGMLYAIIVFPKSSSGRRPRSTTMDLIAGSAALAILALAAGMAAVRIMQG